MNWITIATLLTFAAYLFYIGVIPSISDSYREKKVDRRIYHAFFFVVAVLIAAQGLYTRLDIPYLITGFLFYCISLAASFWQRREGILHVAFTYSAIALGTVMTTLQVWPTWGLFALIPPVVLIAGGLLMKELVRWNVTFWQEILAIVTVFGPIVFY